MVREKLEEMNKNPSRWLDQIIGAFVTIVTGMVVAWAADFVHLPRDVKELKDTTATKEDIKIIKTDMDDRTRQRKEEDGNLKKQQEDIKRDLQSVHAEHQVLMDIVAPQRRTRK